MDGAILYILFKIEVCILIAGKIRDDSSGMYGVVVVWASYLVKYLSELYKFGTIRKIRLQYNYVYIEFF